MVELNLPRYNVKFRKKGEDVFIWDIIRRKYIFLTPEEWVRQHFVNYLISEKEYPYGLIANEKQIQVANMSKRCDSIVYNRELYPLVIVEYKSPDVQITQQVFDQIVRYNFALKVKYLIVSNGLSHYCCAVDYEKQVCSYLEDIPAYDEL